MFLPEDEKRERSSLSAEERKAIEADLKGNQEFEETEEMRRTGIQSLHDAMNDDVETMDKAAYLEACAQVPELVERESSPIAFLRSEQYDGKVGTSARMLDTPTFEVQLHLTIFVCVCVVLGE